MVNLDARRSEFARKIERLRAWLVEERLDGVLISRRDNFAWATAGGDNHVSSVQETGVADLWVDHEQAVVLANNIEAARIDEEEMEGLDVEIFAWPWYKDAEAEIHRFVGARAAASDIGKAGLRDRRSAIAALRYQLVPEEVARYEELGRLTAEAVEGVAFSTSKRETESQVAARLTSALVERGLEPVVTLVAADGRIERYRHPIPKDLPIERAAMLVSCARKGGLIASITRIVHFGRISSDLSERHAAVTQIDAAIMAATRPGRTGAQLFDDIVRFYAEAGYPGEWELHHQGGATGYASRDWKAAPSESKAVLENQAFAWNPSITGTKSEDTIVVTADSFRILTRGKGRWPMRPVEVAGAVIERPDILIL